MSEIHKRALFYYNQNSSKQTNTATGDWEFTEAKTYSNIQKCLGGKSYCDIQFSTS